MHWLLSGPLSVEKLTIKIVGLPASLQGKKLVQMSDFHYDGLRLSDEMLEEAIALSNQTKPDIEVLKSGIAIPCRLGAGAQKILTTTRQIYIAP